MGRLRRPFGNLSVIILKKKMELCSILILQGFQCIFQITHPSGPTTTTTFPIIHLIGYLHRFMISAYECHIE